MNYRPSDVTVTIEPNSLLANLGQAARIVAIVGLGPTTQTIVDQQVFHGTGSVDNLPAGTGITVSQIASRQGLLPGALDYVTGSLGSLYSPSAYSVSATGVITWTTPPTQNTVYYVTYVRSIPTTQYVPIMYTNKTALVAAYGTESNTTGILTVGGSIVLENGSPGVLVVQAQGSTFNRQNYYNAIDMLKKKDLIEDVICLFPTGSMGSGVTNSDVEAVQAYLYQHVQWCNQIYVKKERGMGVGQPSVNYMSDGFDLIGDQNTPESYVGRSTAFHSQDTNNVVPSVVTRVAPDGSVMQLDGNFAACAVAGLRAAQPRRSTPLHGATLIGISIPDDYWDENQKLMLGAGNCMVLQSTGGIITIYDAITTDPTSAETTEYSIPAVKRLVKRSIRDQIRNTYLNKGLTITTDVLSDIEGTTTTILNSLVNQGEIAAYGVQTDPTTGEIPIKASLSGIDPRGVKVVGSVAYAFPLKFIDFVLFPFV